MSKTKKTSPASVHQRLLDRAKRENRPLNELLQHYAIERFLYRLGNSKYRKNFVLKGAQMLRVWDSPSARPTMDVDLLGNVDNDIANLERIVRECLLIEADDGVAFDPASVAGEAIRKDGDYQGVRIKARGLLGKIRLHLQIDVGFGDAVLPAPIEVELPQLLDMGSPTLLGYTPESAVAEKFQAMVALDMTNTRLKDFYDVWLLCKTIDLDRETLAAAIRETFHRRQTPLPTETPAALTPAFSEHETKERQWQAFLRKNRLNPGITLREAADAISEFLLPLFLDTGTSTDRT